MGKAEAAGSALGPTSTVELNLREMLDALPLACYVTDTDGRLTYFNRAAIALSGRVPEIGTDKWCVTWKLFNSDGAPMPHDQCPMAVVLTGRQVKPGQECIAERPDGSRFWFTPYPTVLRDAKGRITGGMNMLVDITERKTALGQSEAEFRTIFETTPECVKIVAPDGTLLQMNASGLSMICASSAQAVIGKSVYDLVAPEDRERFREFNERVCTGERASLEFDIIGLGGDRRHMETHAAPLTYSDGSTVQLGVARDVSDRKRAEQAAQLLSAIVDSSDDAIISKDLNGIITSWNKSAERLFGYTAAEAVGQPVATLLIPADRQNEETNILAKLRKGERVDHFETKRKRKDGTLIDISLTISPVRDASGTIIGASKIARDITDQIRSQRELRQANDSLTRSNADLEQFAYSASHDLQEPLRMVSAYSEMLRRKFENKLGATGDEYIGIVVEGARRMEQLLRDLRAYAHTSTVNDGPSPVVSTDNAIERSITNLTAAIDESGAEITCDPLPPVRMHEVQLVQLFQNIIGNAIRYRSDERPRIHLGAEPEGDAWRFFIQDNGIGIDPEYKEQIFGIFKRLHTSSEYPGTGMGLAICQRIVERAGGRIWWNLSPEGVRRFSLPFQPLKLAEPQTSTTAPQIVLIEDNRADVGLVLEALEQHNVRCDVTVIGNGEIAFEFIDEIDAGQHPCPDLFIIDLNLPKKPGKEVLKRMRSSAACKNVPVVVLTSSDLQKDKDDIAPFTPLHYLRKPSELDAFISLGALFKQIVHDRA